MPRRYSEKQKRVLRRRVCVHGHPMKRSERHRRPECSECCEPVCIKHTVQGYVGDWRMGIRIRCCSQACFDAYAVRWALENALRPVQG